MACSGHININTTQSPPHPQSQQQPAVIGVMFSSNQQPADNLDILTVSRTWPILPPMFLIGSSPLQLLRCGGIFKINGMVTLMYWLILAQQLGSWAKKGTLARGFCAGEENRSSISSTKCQNLKDIFVRSCGKATKEFLILDNLVHYSKMVLLCC